MGQRIQPTQTNPYSPWKSRSGLHQRYLHKGDIGYMEGRWSVCRKLRRRGRGGKAQALENAAMYYSMPRVTAYPRNRPRCCPGDFSQARWEFVSELDCGRDPRRTDANSYDRWTGFITNSVATHCFSRRNWMECWRTTRILYHLAVLAELEGLSIARNIQFEHGELDTRN